MRRRNRGFSLLEVLVTLLIVSIGLLGLAGMQTSGIRSNQGSYLRSQATVLAGSIVDAMRANDAAARNGAYNVGYGDGVGGGGVAGDDLTLWRQSVANSLPNGQSMVQVDANGETRVGIRWSDTTAENEQSTFVFETQL